MTLKDKLEIILITCDRKTSLKETLNEILDESSPVKDFSITILNNNSTDGTTELLEDYAKKYPNLKHICHKKNIGGNANIVRAFETATKDYLWLLADNDHYDWSSWDEIETAIDQNYDGIITLKGKNIPSNIFYSASLISGCIYKTSNFTETVFFNAYDNIRFLFPQLAFCAKNINDNNRFYTVSKNIVNIMPNPDMKNTYNRGMNYEEIPTPRRNIFWSVGYLTSTELIKDKKIRTQVIDELRHHHKSLFELFRSMVILNKIQKKDYFYNYQQILRTLNFKQKIKFILAYLTIQFSIKNYDYWFLRYEDEWIEYLELIQEQKYIENLAKKFKNKKILFYGAGLTAKVLFENCDLSKLNIIGISDKKFETEKEQEFYGIKTISPNKINELDFDIVLFTLKEYKKIANILKQNGCDKQMLSIIKKTRFVIKT